jgi:DNA-binding NarL/FixJ family response regulator
MNQTRVLIVDDHAVVRQGIHMFLNTVPSIQIVGEAEDVPDAVNQAKRLGPDVILMDLVFPRGDGIEAIAEIKGYNPNIKIIALTTFEDEARVRGAMEAGADGYQLKDADAEALVNAIQAVQRGDMPLHPRVTQYLVRSASRPQGLGGNNYLTVREKEVLILMARGLSNGDIARMLSLQTGTVKVHVGHILEKLGVSNRTEAAVLALQRGLIPPVEEA